ncbi:MAG: hypothetical protein ABI707_06860 [Ferruginibacter sp.]
MHKPNLCLIAFGRQGLGPVIPIPNRMKEKKSSVAVTSPFGSGGRRKQTV